MIHREAMDGRRIYVRRPGARTGLSAPVGMHALRGDPHVEGGHTLRFTRGMWRMRDAHARTARSAHATRKRSRPPALHEAHHFFGCSVVHQDVVVLVPPGLSLACQWVGPADITLENLQG